MAACRHWRNTFSIFGSLSSMELGGWGGCGQAPGQPFAQQQRDELMSAADGSFCAEELEGLQAWALRVLLQRPLLHSQLRALALGGPGQDASRR